MQRNDILERVSQIFEDLFGLDRSEVTPQTSPDTVDNWLSLQHLHLIAAVEETFEIVLTPEEQSEMLSVELILGILEARVGSN